jgi:hypothetical protein
VVPAGGGAVRWPGPAGAAAAYERQCALDLFAANARATLEKIRARLAKTAK